MSPDPRTKNRICRGFETAKLADISQRDRLLAHLEAHSQARAQELRNVGVAATTVSRAVETGLVLRIGRGLYELPDSKPDAHSALIEVAKRAPKAVICLTSALAFHDLTDLLPRKVWIAIGAKDWPPKIDYPSIRIVRLREPYFLNGVERHIAGGVELKVYSVTKTIADAFRLPKLVDRAAAISALKTSPAITGLVRGVPFLVGVFALAKGAVRDLAQQAGVVVQGADVTPVDLVGVGLKVNVAEGFQPLQHLVDLELGSHECVEDFGVGGVRAEGCHGGCPLSELHRFRVTSIALMGR
jgi:hypothetical protein